MKSTKTLLRSSLLCAVTLIPGAAFASVQITEVMYDLEGADSGFEWVEVTNTGDTAVDIGAWRLLEAQVHHKLMLSKGASTVLAPGTSAVIADKPENFLSHWPQVQIVFDSAFSLSNTGESLALKNGTELVDQISYTAELGAKGDGGSLHRKDGMLVAALPNPGVFPGELRAVPAKTNTASAKSATQAVQKDSSNTVKAGNAVPQSAAPAASQTGSSLFPWILGLLSIIGLGVAAVLLVRLEGPKPETPDPSDEFEIIDATGKTL